ncbi:DDE-type integrase/transposase/recombinase [Salmonella enterica]|nr:DDE-type integrase/transposase/recombinase [Salmonella enterica]
MNTSLPLELLHLDLFDCHSIPSLDGNKYCLVIVDDFSRYTWVYFMRHKDDTLEIIVGFSKRVENERNLKINRIRSDHGGEFENAQFTNFCLNNGYKHEFSCPRTPQQNGVVERKNRALQEAARTMLNAYSLPSYFWAEAINTACYIQNRVVIHRFLEKTSFELWNDTIPTIQYFKVFGCKVYILNTKDNLGKFESKSDEGIFLGYSSTSRGYRVYNKRTQTVEESSNVKFDETNRTYPRKSSIDKDINDKDQSISQGVQNLSLDGHDQGGEREDSDDERRNVNVDQIENDVPSPPRTMRIHQNHPIDQVVGEVAQGVRTRSHFRDITS